MSDHAAFLNPRFPYRGHFSPDNLVFNANLQEFALRVGYISALETGGHLTPEDAYLQLRSHWQRLRTSAENLGITLNSSDDHTHG